MSEFQVYREKSFHRYKCLFHKVMFHLHKRATDGMLVSQFPVQPWPGAGVPLQFQVP